MIDLLSVQRPCQLSSMIALDLRLSSQRVEIRETVFLVSCFAIEPVSSQSKPKNVICNQIWIYHAVTFREIFATNATPPKARNFESKKRPEIMSKRKEEINGIQITSIVFNSVIIVSYEKLLINQVFEKAHRFDC